MIQALRSSPEHLRLPSLCLAKTSAVKLTLLSSATEPLIKGKGGCLRQEKFWAILEKIMF
jgi:hypothetical protein